MVGICSAFGCTNSAWKESSKKRGISYHCFPKDKILLRRWLINIRRANFQPSINSKLCSEHFTDDSFVHQPFIYCRRLKKGAIPTLFSFTKDHNRKAQGKKRQSSKHTSQKLPSSSQGKSCYTSNDPPSTSNGYEAPDSSDFAEFISSGIDFDEMEENTSALLDRSMNEKFYPSELLKASSISVSKCSTSNRKSHGILEGKNQLKKKLKAKIFLKALKKQWLDAEIKAAKAKKDYYETKNMMLTKLQNDLYLENSSDFETSTALQNLKTHVKKEELASNIEKKMLKQQLKEAVIASNNCERECYETEFGISFSDDMCDQ